MDNTSITQYITTERARGVSDPDIRAALLASGWNEALVNEAFGTPVPEELPASTSALSRMFSGRIGRWQYFMTGLLLGVMCLPLVAIALMSVFWGVSRHEGMLPVLIVGMIVIPLFLVVVSTGLSVRRLHDLGRSGWWVLLNFIPYVSMGLAIYLLFFRGMTTGNAYGRVDTTPRTLAGVWGNLWGRRS